MQVYNGVFFDKKDILKIVQDLGLEDELLPRVIDNPHITFNYNGRRLKAPNNMPLSVIGNGAEAMITGYGNDGENMGFRVEIPDSLNKLYNGANPIHITIALSENANAVNTKNLEFTDIDPIYITGKIAYCNEKNQVVEDIETKRVSSIDEVFTVLASLDKLSPIQGVEYIMGKDEYEKRLLIDRNCENIYFGIDTFKIDSPENLYDIVSNILKLEREKEEELCMSL